jgi:hypothetical protein
MRVHLLFGVKSKDIEEGREWLEEALKLPSQGRHNEYEGDYYSFGDIGEEYIKLCSGVSEDEDGEYPTDHDFPDWALLVFLNRSRDNSTMRKALEGRPDRFEKLRESRFE